MRYPKTFAVAVLGGVAAASVSSASPASADSGVAVNQRQITLTNGTTTGLSQACVTLSIYLAAGNYYWDQFLQDAVLSDRQIYLAAGTYSWTVCVHPETGQGQYELASSLGKSGSATARLANAPFSVTGGPATVGGELEQD